MRGERGLMLKGHFLLVGVGAMPASACVCLRLPSCPTRHRAWALWEGLKPLSERESREPPSKANHLIRKAAKATTN